MVLHAPSPLSIRESPTSTAPLSATTRYSSIDFGHICTFNDQDWCNTDDDGKWGNCNSECKGGVPGCFKTNVKYSPTNDFLGARWSAETSAEACKARCAGHPECAFFSFWAKDLKDDNGCTLFGSAATLEGNKTANTYITGPATCPGEILSSS